MDAQPPNSAPSSSFVLDADDTTDTSSCSNNVVTVPAGTAELPEANSQARLPPSMSSVAYQHSDAVATQPAEPSALEQQQPSAAAFDTISQQLQQSTLDSPRTPRTTTISDVLDQLTDNASAIRTAEEVLEHLLLKQTALMQLEQHLEQQLVISAISQPLGFHKGRPVAAMLLLRCVIHRSMHMTEYHGVIPWGHN